MKFRLTSASCWDADELEQSPYWTIVKDRVLYKEADHSGLPIWIIEINTVDELLSFLKECRNIFETNKLARWDPDLIVGVDYDEKYFIKIYDSYIE